MKFVSACLGLILLPTLAQAACPKGAEVLISCTFNKGAKTVETCLDGGTVTYAFGAPGKTPELSLTHTLGNVDMQPWSGFGRWISEGFTLSNGAYRYVLRYAIDRLSEDDQLEADLWVGKGTKQLALLHCDAGSVDTSGYPLPLFDAKLAAGQVWDPNEMIWVSTPQDR